MRAYVCGGGEGPHHERVYACVCACMIACMGLYCGVLQWITHGLCCGTEKRLTSRWGRKARALEWMMPSSHSSPSAYGTLLTTHPLFYNEPEFCVQPGSCPRCYRVTNHPKERPDVWVVDPRRSVVLEVGAFICLYTMHYCVDAR